MSIIDAVLYINLGRRTDRNEHIHKEIVEHLGIEPNKIHRIDAISKWPGCLGCGLSHIKAIQYAMDHPEWNLVLILEDDFTFKSSSPEINQSSLRSLVMNVPHMDVGLLSYNHRCLQKEDTIHPTIKKVINSQTTSSYLTTRMYRPTLLQNMKESTYDMRQNGSRHENCIDIYWNKLQPLGNWYAVYPAIGHQYDNFSDIEHCHKSYDC